MKLAFGVLVIFVIIDEHEHETGKRQEGIFFAASSFSAKATTGIGNVIAGIALDLISWPRGRTRQDRRRRAAGDAGPSRHGVRARGRGVRVRLGLVLYARYPVTQPAEPDGH